MARHDGSVPKQTKTKSKHPIAALTKNKMAGPGVKFTDWRASSGERMAVARAKVAEKFTHVRASMRLAFMKVKHPIHPIKRSAAKTSAKEMKEAATARREQKVANARSTASRKKALVRERRSRKLNQNI